MNISAILRPTPNLTSYGSADMRPFRTATCFHELNTANCSLSKLVSSFWPYVLFSCLVFGSKWDMTKRDSVVAGFTFPPLSMSMPCRHSRSAGHTGNTTDLPESSHISSYSTGHHENPTWPTRPGYGSANHSHPTEYAVPSSSVPLSTTASYQTPIIPQPEEEAYPLQQQIEENRRQLHAHYFVEVRTPHADQTQPWPLSPYGDRSGPTWGPSEPPTRVLLQWDHWPHSSWSKWMDRFLGSINPTCKLLASPFQYPWRDPNRTEHYHHRDAPESPASRQESSMDDADSIAVNVDITPPPVQIHQLATILWNILNNDREANMAIIERLEDPDDDLTRHPVQIFSAADLAHLAGHLAESTRNLSDQAHQMEALSDISDWTWSSRCSEP